MRTAADRDGPANCAVSVDDFMSVYAFPVVDDSPLRVETDGLD